MEAGPWTFTTANRTAGMFANHGREVTERSPGLVQVSDPATGWENYINMRSQLYGGVVNGANGNEWVNAYCMVRSATEKDDGKTIDTGSQAALLRNVGGNSSQTVYL